MRPWVRQAGTYAIGYAGVLVLAALAVGVIPGIPLRGPVFAVSILGAIVAFLAIWGAEEPTVEDLPETQEEGLPVPWRMLLFGGGVMVLSWTVMLVPF
ncbi:MAG: hypothetical protein ABEJ57_01155 [Halobacteriaceae archaeon]